MTGDQAYDLAKSYVKKTAEGLGAVKGKDGFSPIIAESAKNSDDNYQIKIITESESFTTPNLLGRNGKDGYTPYIGLDGNWYINGIDTGVKSTGKDGKNGVDGLTPTIDEATKHWMIGSFDTGVLSRGTNGFSPTISVKTDTETEYVLEITDENGSYETPNLKGRAGSGGGGTESYSSLTNKPKINGVELDGELSLEDLGIREISNTEIENIIKSVGGL